MIADNVDNPTESDYIRHLAPFNHPDEIQSEMDKVINIQDPNERSEASKIFKLIPNWLIRGRMLATFKARETLTYDPLLKDCDKYAAQNSDANTASAFIQEVFANLGLTRDKTCELKRNILDQINGKGTHLKLNLKKFKMSDTLKEYLLVIFEGDTDNLFNLDKNKIEEINQTLDHEIFDLEQQLKRFKAFGDTINPPLIISHQTDELKYLKKLRFDIKSIVATYYSMMLETISFEQVDELLETAEYCLAYEHFNITKARKVPAVVKKSSLDEKQMYVKEILLWAQKNINVAFKQFKPVIESLNEPHNLVLLNTILSVGLISYRMYLDKNGQVEQPLIFDIGSTSEA